MTPETISMISAGIALLAAGGSWGAVLVNRWNATDTIRTQINTGARTSRAAVVSANRQKWIDAVREDVAEFIAVRAQLRVLGKAGSMERQGQDALLKEERELQTKLIMLRELLPVSWTPR